MTEALPPHKPVPTSTLTLEMYRKPGRDFALRAAFHAAINANLDTRQEVRRLEQAATWRNMAGVLAVHSWDTVNDAYTTGAAWGVLRDWGNEGSEVYIGMLASNQKDRKRGLPALLAGRIVAALARPDSSVTMILPQSPGDNEVDSDWHDGAWQSIHPGFTDFTWEPAAVPEANTYDPFKLPIPAIHLHAKRANSVILSGALTPTGLWPI